MNNSGVFDEYSTNISSFNEYGAPALTTETFNGNKRVTKQTYDHDISKWILNQPRLTDLSSDGASFTRVAEIEYFGKLSVSRAFMPHRVLSYGVWQKKYISYYAGNLTKVEFNASLDDGSGNTYQAFANYKRGIPQTITVPNRYATGTISESRVVDDNGWITQTTDYENNVINYGYDNLGRIKYIDPVDTAMADTLYTWSYTVAYQINIIKFPKLSVV